MRSIQSSSHTSSLHVMITARIQYIKYLERIYKCHQWFSPVQYDFVVVVDVVVVVALLKMLLKMMMRLMKVMVLMSAVAALVELLMLKGRDRSPQGPPPGVGVGQYHQMTICHWNHPPIPYQH